MTFPLVVFQACTSAPDAHCASVGGWVKIEVGVFCNRAKVFVDLAIRLERSREAIRLERSREGLGWSAPARD